MPVTKIAIKKGWLTFKHRKCLQKHYAFKKNNKTRHYSLTEAFINHCECTCKQCVYVHILLIKASMRPKHLFYHVLLFKYEACSESKCTGGSHGQRDFFDMLATLLCSLIPPLCNDISRRSVRWELLMRQ